MSLGGGGTVRDTEARLRCASFLVVEEMKWQRQRLLLPRALTVDRWRNRVRVGAGLR